MHRFDAWWPLAWAVAVIAGCEAPPEVPCGTQCADLYTRPDPAPTMAVLFAPRTYSAPWVTSGITLDGRLDEGSWKAAPWTADFLDIEGPARPAPWHRTRVKMMWDRSNLYVAAELEERDLWATLTHHDEIVYRDNDFEIFVDPDGDTREYYEIEVNAIGTIFDLYLPVPYRAGAKANHDWTARGMRVAIHCDGTINDSRDIDRAWQLEIAIPWSVFTPMPPALGESTHQPRVGAPRAGDSWHINFSRVQWMLEKQGDSYAKVSGRPEENWTWTPQWMVDMHVPQWWGVVTFVAPRPDREESSK